MAIATISSSGTWSTLDDSADAGGKPRQFTDTLEERFAQDGLDWFNQNQAEADGYPEMVQFIGLFAAGYSIPTGAALDRIIQICRSMRTGQNVEKYRHYPSTAPGI